VSFVDFCHRLPDASVKQANQYFEALCLRMDAMTQYHNETHNVKKAKSGN